MCSSYLNGVDDLAGHTNSPTMADTDMRTTELPKYRREHGSRPRTGHTDTPTAHSTWTQPGYISPSLGLIEIREN
jgi:hypothetical protein